MRKLHFDDWSRSICSIFLDVSHLMVLQRSNRKAETAHFRTIVAFHSPTDQSSGKLMLPTSIVCQWFRGRLRKHVIRTCLSCTDNAVNLLDLWTGFMTESVNLNPANRVRGSLGDQTGHSIFAQELVEAPWLGEQMNSTRNTARLGCLLLMDMLLWTAGMKLWFISSELVSHSFCSCYLQANCAPVKEGKHHDLGHHKTQCWMWKARFSTSASGTLSIPKCFLLVITTKGGMCKR